jgi:hypothetical protein
MYSLNILIEIINNVYGHGLIEFLSSKHFKHLKLLNWSEEFVIFVYILKYKYSFILGHLYG